MTKILVLICGALALAGCDTLKASCGGSGPLASVAASVESDLKTGDTKARAEVQLNCGGGP